VVFPRWVGSGFGPGRVRSGCFGSRTGVGWFYGVWGLQTRVRGPQETHHEDLVVTLPKEVNGKTRKMGLG